MAGCCACAPIGAGVKSGVDPVVSARPIDLLERYGRVARALYSLRMVLYAGMAVGLAFFVYGVLAPGSEAGAADGGNGQETRMFLPLVVILWCVCLTMFMHGFRGVFPAVAADDGWFARLKVRLVRGVWHLLAVGVVALGAGTLLLTARAIMMLGR